MGITSVLISMERYLILTCLLLSIVLAEEAVVQDIGERDQQQTVQESLTYAIADFTESLYADIAKRSFQENFVFSPLSIHSALSLLYAGSTPNSKTQAELSKALKSIASIDLIKAQYKTLIESYKEQQSFLYGNSIWTQNGFDVEKSFKADIKEHFDAETENIDFKNDTSVGVINSWISKRTRGLIPKLVQGFPSSTSMFLANALYFKDQWLVPFQEKNESGDSLNNELFHGEFNMKVPMMLTSNVNIGAGVLNLGTNNATFVTIPYINDQFEMQIILPSNKPDGKGLAILEDFVVKNTKRDKHNVDNIFLSPKQAFDNVEDVRLMMPKFSVSSKFDASDYLKSLGITQLFRDAELEKVDKEGTVGAAATGVELVLLSGSFGRNIDVNVDRPFIFIVQDKKNNIPILVGRIKNPLK